jgi:hypothetical protein
MFIHQYVIYTQNIIRIGLVHDPLTSVWLITADPHKGGSISLMPDVCIRVGAGGAVAGGTGAGDQSRCLH